MTLREAIAMGAARLGGETAGRDAQFLLLHTLALAKTALFMEPQRELRLEELTSYEAALARRARESRCNTLPGSRSSMA